MKQHELFNKYVPSQCIDGEGSIITFTGRVISPLKPRPEQICIEDIAHALGNTCRFSGHTSRYISVAEHCIRVSRVLRKLSPAMGMLGLLHDATEAYLTDIPRPYKHLLVGYKEYETALANCIFEALGMPFREPFGAEVKDADELLLAVEQYELMPDTKFWPRILSKEEHSHYVKEYGSLHCMGNMMATDVYMHEYLHLQDLMHDELVRGTKNND